MSLVDRRAIRPAAAILSIFTLLITSAPTHSSAKSLATWEKGIVETLAGPDFCPAGAFAHPAELSPGAMAVDLQDRLYIDSGGGSSRFIQAVDRPQATVVPTGQALGRRAATVGALAPAGQGEVVVADEKRLLRVNLTGPSVDPLLGLSDRREIEGNPSGLGDGGPAGGARFIGIRSITGDEAQNLFVADRTSARARTVRIRFINRSPQPVTFYRGTPREITVAPGHIDTIAEPGRRSPAPRGSALYAHLEGAAPAMAATGMKVYFAAYSSRQGASVQLINLGAEALSAHGQLVEPGAVVTVAGGTAGRSARFSFLPGIAADQAGNLFLAARRENQVLKIDSDGRRTVFAGSAAARAGFNGNDRAARGALLNRPYDVEVGGGGRIYVSDRGNGQVRFVEESGLIHRAASYGPLWSCRLPSGRGDSSPLQSGKVGAVVAGGKGRIYFSDPTTGQVFVRDPAGTVRGLPARVQGSLLAFSGKGGLYTANRTQVRYLNLRATKVLVSGLTVAPRVSKVVAGSGKSGSGGDGALALKAQLSMGGVGPGGLAVDSKGILFITDEGNRRVRQIGQDGTITTIAGEGAPGTRGACCRQPTALAVDKAGNLYVGDSHTEQIWAINRGRQVSSILGHRVPPGEAAPVAGDKAAERFEEGGNALQTALIGGPTGLTTDSLGNLYLTAARRPHGSRHGVEKIDQAGKINSVVGTGQRGFNGDGRPGLLTSLASPTALAFDHCGNLLISDSGNDRIRRFNMGGAC